MTATPPLYRWGDHPQMPPRPASYFIAYWSSMPRPLSAKAAGEEFTRLVRQNALIQVREKEKNDG